MNVLPTQETLNMIPLGSCDPLIGMDWLDTHKTKLDCYKKKLSVNIKKGEK
jgi:hypothetical protein